MSGRFKSLAAFILIITTFLLMTAILSSCLSSKNRARKLVRKGHEKIEKGLQLDPSLADSIKGKKTIYIKVPGKTDTVFLNPEINLDSFNSAVKNYDSLLIATNELEKDLNNKSSLNVNLESKLAKLQKLTKELEKARERFKPAFQIDSTYVVQDSVGTFSITVEKGLLKRFKYHIPERQVSKDVETTTVNLDGRKVIGRFYEDPWFLVFLVVVIIIIILVRKL